MHGPQEIKMLVQTNVVKNNRRLQSPINIFSMVVFKENSSDNYMLLIYLYNNCLKCIWF